MKRCVALLLALLIASICPAAYADTPVELYGAAAAVAAPLSGDVLLAEENADEQLSVAGLVKLPAILTLALSFDKGLILAQTQMQCSKNASTASGPTAFLEAGETIAASELMKAAVMISAGDAILALGENAFGSGEVFLQNIGVTLSELGISPSMSDCLGTGSRFTARELLIMAQAAAQSPCFLQYAGLYYETLTHTDGRSTELVNANRMIRSFTGCFGLLTGSSRDDGYCGVFAATRNDVSYAVVVIGCRTSELRFSCAGALFDYAFANYRVETLAGAGKPVLDAWPVEGGTEKSVALVAHEDAVLLLNAGAGAVSAAYRLPETLQAPLYAEQSVGEAVFTAADGTELAVVALYPSKSIEGFGIRDILVRLARSYLSG